ncbi:hypothetical protein PISMIDRAFT_679605 [Pisolithus microcarpus 441]|uniref:Uncharacterized protein n=1 Tax=Pisolithus microcarpus 441 TaxID=765257 RepID=A0A0C9Z247_9AGAM|nr:hypothetical protein BKA83DRAFT_679605 [Pisolithus microcarpus]KIK23111.1 hypothetical protein PISMIDRAFT_679605 [Pisolithus microcarpus 441]
MCEDNTLVPRYRFERSNPFETAFVLNLLMENGTELTYVAAGPVFIITVSGSPPFLIHLVTLLLSREQ